MSHTFPLEAYLNVEQNVPHHQNNSIITQVNDSHADITTMSHTFPSEASFNVERNVPHHQNNSIITQVNDSLTNITKMSHNQYHH
jgi:hypothetical protein